MLIILDGQLAHVAGDLSGYRREIGLQVSIIGPLPPSSAFPTRPVGRHNDNDANGDDKYEDSPCELEESVPVNRRNAHRLLLHACSHIRALNGPACCYQRALSCTSMPPVGRIGRPPWIGSHIEPVTLLHRLTVAN